MSRPSIPGRAPTVYEVARHAGVGKTTVSAVVNGREHVNPALRERVLQAIDELGYRPNLSARSLALSRTDILGVVAGDLFDSYHAEILSRLQREASTHGYKVLITTSGDDHQDEPSAIRSLLDHPVEAILLVAFSGDAGMEPLLTTPTPVVFTGFRSRLGPSVAVDDEKGADLATTHLLELGHRRIAYVSYEFLAAGIDERRLAGHRRALARAGVTEASVTRLGGISAGDRTPALRALLEGPDRPTAVFATADHLAIEVLDCADGLGLRIPEDLSVAGFDDVPLAGLARISLTTVAQPIDEIARRTVEAAVTRLQDGTPPATQLLEPRLVVRGSTGPA